MKQVICDSIKVENGRVFMRFKKEESSQFGDFEACACEYHRTSFPVTEDFDAQMAIVNEHLGRLGFPMINDLPVLKAAVAIKSK